MATVRRSFYTPNSKLAVIERWQLDGRIRAIGAIAYAGGVMSGKRLAAILGVSPRGLRQVLLKDAVFQVEIRDGERGRGETWYRLNQAAIPPPEPLPPLRRQALTYARDNRQPVAPARRQG